MPAGGAITGFLGSAGVVEGQARVIATVEGGDQLQTGEILLTTVTNVWWTPLFPPAAAVVTDVGAPLSHAAIVAREMGIPAVIGCGDATMRLKTGDRVRVDGGKGLASMVSRSFIGRVIVALRLSSEAELAPTFRLFSSAISRMVCIRMLPSGWPWKSILCSARSSPVS
jgi:phosphohistidine swiveling domain-containing protein